MPILLFAAWLAIILGCADLALAQQNGHTHDGEVGKFYMSWMIPNPNGRSMSCCAQIDCRPVMEMRFRGDGLAEVRVVDSMSWYPIPNQVWEDVQPDPRESPDGRTHVCIRAGIVVCAVRGSDG